MQMKKLWIGSILLIFSLFIGINNVRAETETYCRYSYDRVKSSNIVRGFLTGANDAISNFTGFLGGLFGQDWDYYNKDELQSGALSNIIFDIVDVNGGIDLRGSRSSNLFVRFTPEGLPASSFFNGGSMTCPSVLYARVDGYSNNGYMRLTIGTSTFSNDENYYFNLVGSGPQERSTTGGAGDEFISMSEASCSGVLGPFKMDLEGALKAMQIIGPLMVIILGTYDYAAATFSKDAELLKKSNSRLTRRLVLVAVLFFLPILLNIILGIIDTSYTTCIM